MLSLVQDVAHAVKRLQARQHRALDARLREVGLSVVQWNALRQLAQQPGLSLHDLAGLSFQSDQSMGALAQRMNDRGLIERLDGPGRAVRHRVTALGDELLDRGGRIVDDELLSAFAVLDEQELVALRTLLDRLLATDPAREQGIGDGATTGIG